MRSGPSSRPWGRLLSRAPLFLLVALAVSLPFELIVPLWTVGPFVVTNLELLLFLTLGLTAVLLLQSPDKWVKIDRYWLWLPLLASALFISALLAPQLAGNAFKAALRLSAGMALALAAIQIMRRPGDGRIVSAALVTGGLIAALIGWWEISQAELAWASLFRSHITRVGSILRLTGTFAYANQAAMFMEATFPFLIAAAYSINRQTIRAHVKIPLWILLFLLTLFYAQAIILTLSRAGAATVVVVCLLLAVGLAATGKRKMAVWWLGAAGITAVLIAANILVSDQFRLRLQGGNVDNWYLAQIDAPAALEMKAGTTMEIPISVVNEGAFVWRSQGAEPILLGARLLDAEGARAYNELRWPFPHSVSPQETAQLTAPFTAPHTPGVYELRWDVVQENAIWFGAKSGRYASSWLTVLPGDEAAPPPPEPFVMNERSAWEYSGPVPNRTALWTVAWQMIVARPLVGLGMDNYRFRYGEWLDGSNYDNTVHSNNFYLEMIVSLGLVGALPFFLWAAGLLLDMAQTLRRPEATIWQAATAAGLLAFFIHGFFDFFLLFNATGLLFWLLAALWLNEKKSYADRI